MQKALKRILCLLVVAFLVVGILSAQLDQAQAADYSIVRVKLSIGSTSSFGFSLSGNYGIDGDPGKSLTSGSYTVKAQNGTLSLYNGSTLVCSGSPIKIVEKQPSSGSYNFATVKTTAHGTNNYRGDLEFRLSGSSVILINHIYLDYYLYGVVPHEMSNTWPIEALKSQAVAARTYAVRYMGGGSYDMVDTAANQVYRGYDPSKNNAIRAVDETAKTVLKSDGKLVQTYYAASNGGYVDIPQHVWSSSATLLPYHVVQADPYDVQNTWSMQEVLIFPKSGSSSIVYQYMDSGKMVTGSSSLSANAERYFKIAALPQVAAKGYIAGVTSDITISGIERILPHTYEGNHGLPDVTGASKCVVYTKADVTMTVLANRYATPDEERLTGQALIQEPVSVTFTINMHELDKSGGMYQAFANTSLRLFVVEETDTSWNIYHRRYGHGVGMSQRGAQTRAKAGQTYRDILSFYYPNTYFETLNITPPGLPAPTPGTDTANATVINCTSYVNVRSTPSTEFPSIGKAAAGARITVTQPDAAQGWHKIDFGGVEAYIYAYYVRLDPPTETPAPTETPVPSETPVPTETPAPTETPVPTETPTPTPAPTETPAPPETPTKPAIAQTGTVPVSELYIRSGPGTTYTRLGSFRRGDSVEIIEVEPVTDWHKIWYQNQEAYVYADFVKLASQQQIEATGVITSSILNIRSGPGTSYSKLGSFSKGDKVQILDANVTADWHKILYNGSVAYVHASYVRIDGTDSGSGSTDGGSTDGGNTGGSTAAYASVNASRLNLRATASLSGTVVTTLSRGDIVQVLEPGSTWTKVKYGGSEGYMYSQYLKASTATYGTVTAGVLNVRSSSSTSSTVLGKLGRGDIVEITQAGGSWHKIIYKSSTAYVYAAYVKIM
jgi:SpoIID/LytB domain protein